MTYSPQRVLMAAAIWAVGFAIAFAYGYHQRKVGALELELHQAKVARDTAALRYQRARAAVVHDTVVVRQTITRYERAAAPIRQLVETDTPVPAAAVRDLLASSDGVASRCAQFLTHTETLVASADTLNLTSTHEVQLLERRRPSTVGKVVSLGIAALAGIGAGVILF